MYFPLFWLNSPFIFNLIRPSLYWIMSSLLLLVLVEVIMGKLKVILCFYFVKNHLYVIVREHSCGQIRFRGCICDLSVIRFRLEVGLVLILVWSNSSVVFSFVFFFFYLYFLFFFLFILFFFVYFFCDIYWI